MEQGQVRSSEYSVTSSTSRRALRGPQGSGRRSGWLARWVPRTAVLVALASATIAVPLADTVLSRTDPFAAAAPVGYPSAVDVLSSAQLTSTPTSLLAAVRGASLVSDTSSRSFERDPLPGCDGEAREAGSNGQVPASDLCTLWDGRQMLRGDAAVALAELNQNFNAAFGRDMCITDTYRTLSEQRRVAAVKPGLAATPGTSNHGWGLAIDLCASENRLTSVMSWLADNAPTYGWDNPDWARRGGSGAYEPWHWEYVPGTTALGTNY